MTTHPNRFDSTAESLKPQESISRSRYNPETIGGEKVERFIVNWIVETKPMAEAYQKQYLTLERAGKLFDEYGPELEIEIHLNRLNPPPSVLFDARWLREDLFRGKHKNGR